MKTFNSFKDLGVALRIKNKAKANNCKCKKCGQSLENITGTNVWMCKFASMEDKELKDGTSVQVFSKCGNVVLAE